MPFAALSVVAVYYLRPDNAGKCWIMECAKVLILLICCSVFVMQPYFSKVFAHQTAALSLGCRLCSHILPQQYTPNMYSQVVVGLTVSSVAGLHTSTYSQILFLPARYVTNVLSALVAGSCTRSPAPHREL